MADINLTQPVTDGDTVTAQILHDMIETATLTGLTAADLSSNVQVLVAQAAAPDPSLYSFWWRTESWEPLLYVYATPYDIWLAAGPDRFDIPFQASEPLFKGACVVSAGASQVGIATGPTINVIGFAQDTAVSGAWVGVATCGLGWVSAPIQADGASQEAFTAVGADAGQVVTANFNLASNATSVVCLGVYIDSLVANQTWTQASLNGARALIWGPKRTIGFN